MLIIIIQCFWPWSSLSLEMQPTSSRLMCMIEILTTRLLPWWMGGATVAAAFHEMNSHNNHHDINDTDNNDNSLQLSKRKHHGGALFWSTNCWFNLGWAKRAIYKDYTCWKILFMGLNLGFYFGCPKHNLKTWLQKSWMSLH